MTENGADSGRRRSPLWLKILGIGCGGILVFVVIIGVAIALNWPRFAGYYQQAKSMMSQIVTVQAAVQKKYAAEVRIVLKRESGVQGSILSVTLVNAPQMDRIDVDGPDGRALALEVATTARDALPPGDRYDNYEVVFRRERGVTGATMSPSWAFRFAAADLPPAKAGSGG